MLAHPFFFELYREAKQWELMEAASKHVAEGTPEEPEGWIARANALRFQERREEARKVANKDI